MKVKALRGVCIGVDRHLKAGDVVDLEPALVTFLTGIGAVERVPDEPPKPDPEAEPKEEPLKDEPPNLRRPKSGSKER
jgi:hypothetical protein